MSPARQLAVNGRFEREFADADPRMKDAISRAFSLWIAGFVYQRGYLSMAEWKEWQDWIDEKEEAG